MHTILRTDPDGEWIVGYWLPGNPQTFERVKSFKDEQDAIDFCSCLNGGHAFKIWMRAT